ncbi:MAG: hypothetical protein MMC33_005449 [Icmadophila ericetorum]|nr:hypothetical protein [Icmadophila ericetorum]
MSNSYEIKEKGHSGELATYGGVGRQSGPLESLDGLKCKTFRSVYPPDVDPRTQIIAQLNCTDPGILQLGSSQLWLACFSPDDLVKIYTRYTHENRISDRRIVLDAQLLLGIMAAKNLHVIPQKLLLERFLGTLRDESQKAKGLSQPILELIFGHGDHETHGVEIGGNGNTTTAPLLTIWKFREAIGTNGETSLLITSCYSGGWVINPALNITAITTASPSNQSGSWARRVSSKAAAGLIHATAALESLFKLEERRRSLIAANPDACEFGAEEDCNEALRESETFAALA